MFDFRRKLKKLKIALQENVNSFHLYFCPPKAVDNQGMTPLHMACIAGQLDSVSLLVEVGVSLLCKDKEGSTPFHLACHEGCVEVRI